jgi:hypothetical protein
MKESKYFQDTRVDDSNPPQWMEAEVGRRVQVCTMGTGPARIYQWIAGSGARDGKTSLTLALPQGVANPPNGRTATDGEIQTRRCCGMSPVAVACG